MDGELRRDLNDCEMGQLHRLLSSLEGISLDPSLVDGLDWPISQHGRFTSKSFYLEMVRCRNKPFPFKCIWISGIPSKVYFFLWNSFLETLRTLDHL